MSQKNIHQVSGGDAKHVLNVINLTSAMTQALKNHIKGKQKEQKYFNGSS